METNEKPVVNFVICEEADRLAHHIAEETAVSTIECMTSTETVDGATWLDISVEGVFEPLNVEADDEIRYLELRNMLRYHPTNHNLVQIVEA